MVALILESRGISARDVQVTDSSEPDHDLGNEPFPGIRETITVARYFDPLEAHADRLALEQAGIKSWVLDGCYRTDDAVGACLQVLPGDLAAAMALVEAEPGPASALPPEAAEWCCPRCGSNKVSEADEILDVPDSSLTLPASSERRVCFFHCASCNHDWSG
jgi:hypothetical protein